MTKAIKDIAITVLSLVLAFGCDARRKLYSHRCFR